MLRVDRNTQKASLACDACPKTFERDSEPFTAAAVIASAQLDRWKPEKHAGVWQHFCPSCRDNRKRGSLL